MLLFKNIAGKKAGVVLVVTMLAALFIVSVIFLSFIPAVQSLVDAALNTSAVAGTPQATAVVNRLQSIWYIAPILFIIVIIIWAINRALNREPLSGGGWG